MSSPNDLHPSGKTPSEKDRETEREAEIEKDAGSGPSLPRSRNLAAAGPSGPPPNAPVPPIPRQHASLNILSLPSPTTQDAQNANQKQSLDLDLDALLGFSLVPNTTTRLGDDVAPQTALHVSMASLPPSDLGAGASSRSRDGDGEEEREEEGEGEEEEEGEGGREAHQNAQWSEAAPDSPAFPLGERAATMSRRELTPDNRESKEGNEARVAAEMEAAVGEQGVGVEHEEETGDDRPEEKKLVVRPSRKRILPGAVTNFLDSLKKNPEYENVVFVKKAVAAIDAALDDTQGPSYELTQQNLKLKVLTEAQTAAIDLQNKLAKAQQAEMTKMRASYLEVKNQLAAAEEARGDELDSDVAKCKKRVQELEAENKRLQEAINEYEDGAFMTEDECAQMSADKDRRHQEDIKDFQADITKNIREKASLERKLLEVQKAHEETQKELESEKKLNASVLDEKSGGRTGTGSDELISKDECKALNETALKEAADRMKELQDEFEKLGASPPVASDPEAREQIARLKKDLATEIAIKESFAKLMVKNTSAFETKTGNLEKRIKELETELQDVKEKNKRLLDQHAKDDAEIRDLTKYSSDLETQAANLQKAPDAALLTAEECAAQNEAANRKLKEEIASLKERIKDAAEGASTNLLGFEERSQGNPDPGSNGEDADQEIAKLNAEILHLKEVVEDLISKKADKADKGGKNSEEVVEITALKRQIAILGSLKGEDYVKKSTCEAEKKDYADELKTLLSRLDKENKQLKKELDDAGFVTIEECKFAQAGKIRKLNSKIELLVEEVRYLRGDGPRSGDDTKQSSDESEEEVDEVEDAIANFPRTKPKKKYTENEFNARLGEHILFEKAAVRRLQEKLALVKADPPSGWVLEKDIEKNNERIVRALRRQHELTQRESTKYQLQNEGLIEQVRSLKMTLEECEDGKKTAEERDLKKEIREAKQKIGKLKRELKDAQGNYLPERNRLRSQVERYKKDLDDCEQKLKACQKKLEDCEAGRKRKPDGRKTLREQIKEIAEKVRTNNSMVHGQAAGLSEMGIATEQQQTAYLEQENRKLRDQIEDLERERFEEEPEEELEGEPELDPTKIGYSPEAFAKYQGLRAEIERLNEIVRNQHPKAEELNRVAEEASRNMAAEYERRIETATARAKKADKQERRQQRAQKALEKAAARKQKARDGKVDPRTVGVLAKIQKNSELLKRRDEERAARRPRAKQAQLDEVLAQLREARERDAANLNPYQQWLKDKKAVGDYSNLTDSERVEARAHTQHALAWARVDFVIYAVDDALLKMQAQRVLRGKQEGDCATATEFANLARRLATEFNEKFEERQDPGLTARSDLWAAIAYYYSGDGATAQKSLDDVRENVDSLGEADTMIYNKWLLVDMNDRLVETRAKGDRKGSKTRNDQSEDSEDRGDQGSGSAD